MTGTGRIVLILAILFVSVGLDQWTKSIAQAELRGRLGTSYLGDLFRFEYAENSGAFLSLGNQLSPTLRFLFLTVSVGILLLICLGYVIWNRRMNLSSTIALSCVIGGGISNFLDRLLRTEGRVVDFMNMGIGSLRTGIFNVADIGIMFGVFFLLFQMRKDPALK